MKRFKFLLLDANIVIKLFSLGLWDALVKQCEIYLAERVIGESDYFEDSAGVTPATSSDAPRSTSARLTVAARAAGGFSSRHR
jgi:hypothetical protein